MSTFQAEYKTFFTSPAGEQFLTFITTSRDTEHETAEDAPETAASHAATARAYRAVQEHINVVTGDKLA